MYSLEEENESVIVQVLESCVKDIVEEFQRGLDNIKKEVNVEVAELRTKIQSCEKEIDLLREENKDLRENMEKINDGKLNKTDIDVALKDSLKEMQFALVCKQQVKTVKIPAGNTSEIVHIHLDEMNEEHHEDEETLETPETTPNTAKKAKFYWKWNKEAESWLLKQCEENQFSRSKQVKMDIFQRGLRQNMWGNNVTWRMRVFNKIDTVSKQLAK